MPQMKGFITFLLAAILCETVSSQCPTSLDLPEHCQYNCSQSVLNCTQHWVSGVLTITRCSDPVTVDLTVQTGSSLVYQARYFVGGPEQSHHTAPNGISAQWSRNTTHLNFRSYATFEGNVSATIIPDLDLPLDPHSCMCDSLDLFGACYRVPQGPASCTTNAVCSSVFCNIPGPGTHHRSYTINYRVDPCEQALRVWGSDHNGQPVEHVYNVTETKVTNPDEGATISTVVVNHNYSMELWQAADAGYDGTFHNFTLIPLIHIILDRSSCSPLKYYPGEVPAPIIYHNESVTAPRPTTPPPTTTPITTPSEPVSTPTIAVTTPTTPTTTPSGPITTPTSPSQRCPPEYTREDDQRCVSSSTCNGFICSPPSSGSVLYDQASLNFTGCTDPLIVDLNVIKDNQTMYQARFYVGGSTARTAHHTAGGGVGISVHWSRNTSHLSFTATGTFDNNAIVTIIPDLEFSLDAHSCMCDSLDSIAANFSIPNAPSTCTTDYTTCSSVNCVFAGAEDRPVNFRVDPCQETLVVLGADENGEPERTVFNETETRPVPEFSGASINVVLVNHNYSMELMLGVDAGQFGQITFIPMTQIILDRSVCEASQLTYYPGEPPTPAIFFPTNEPSTPSMNTTTSSTSSTPSMNTTTSSTPSTPSVNTTTSSTPSTPSVNTTTSSTPSTPSINTTTSSTSSTPSVNTTTSSTSSTPSVNTTTPSVTTPPEVTPPAPMSITAIAVSIPLVILVSLVVVVTVAVVAVVWLRRRRKRAYTFRQLAGEEEDENL